MRDSANPKHWLIDLFLAEAAKLPVLLDRVRRHRPENPRSKLDWLDLLETILVYKLPRLSREELRKMFGYTEIDRTFPLLTECALMAAR